MTETIHVRGEGGMVIAMDLPLPEEIALRLTKGALTQVNADGSPLHIASTPEPGIPAAPDKAPPQAAPKAEWIGWAVANGADPEEAEALTKADLIDQYGAAAE
ncbi:hypothetical protein OHV05_24470 [Kitasatospora sp. NBC_00070]|uniref:hypothetical protein n=1 Tax=Kitasatospora sp. NBC_00070 TaxID=2975962 RepID=UPI0032490B49